MATPDGPTRLAAPGGRSRLASSDGRARVASFAAGVPFRLPRIAVSGVLRPRLLLVCAALAATAFLAFCQGVAMGDVHIPIPDVVRALFGTGDGGTLLIVREFRLPRALTGLLAGFAFGLSGALFQTMTRNPLASPDMIGITQGAGTAVVAGIVLGFGPGDQVLGMAGALVTALLVYALAWRRGTTGYRIVLVGVGLAWMCTSLTDFLIARGGRFEAQAAIGWLVGNLNGRAWSHVEPLAIATAVLVPAALPLGRWTRTLQLGDDVARGLGTPVQYTRFALMIVGVGLVAFGTASAGPLVFVALAAPQIAQRLAGTPWPPPIASGLAGAAAVLSADVVARVIVPGTELPVGVVTGACGAPVLLWLLVRANRAGSGG